MFVEVCLFVKTDSYKCKIRQSEGRWSVSEKYLPFLCPVAHFTVHLHRWHFVPVASASCYLFMHMAIKHVKIGCPRPYNSGLWYSLYPWVYFHAQVHCDISLPDHITVWCNSVTYSSAKQEMLRNLSMLFTSEAFNHTSDMPSVMEWVWMH